MDTDVDGSELQSPFSLSKPAEPITRRQLLRRISAIAAPSFPQVLGAFVGPLVAARMLGNIGNTNELAALGLCNTIMVVLGYSWLWGLGSAIQTKSSQDWGAKNYDAVGVQLQRGIIIMLLFAGIPLAFIWLFAESILVGLRQHEDVARLVGVYARIRWPGIICEIINIAVSRTLNAIGNAKINMVMSSFNLVLLILMYSLLIPRFGFVGAPISVIAGDIITVSGICILAWRDADFRKCWSGLSREALHDWWPYFQIAIPGLLMIIVEAWAWDVEGFLAGYISPAALAVNAISPVLACTMWCFGQSFGNAGTTVIGNLLGEGRGDDAKRVVKYSIGLNFGFTAVWGAMILAFRTTAARSFSTDPAVVSGLLSLIPLNVVFSFVDSNACALSGIIIGAGKQALAAPVMVVCYWMVGMPVGAALAFGAFGPAWGLWGLWSGMLLAVTIHCLCYCAIVVSFDWQLIASQVQERTQREASTLEQ